MRHSGNVTINGGKGQGALFKNRNRQNGETVKGVGPANCVWRDQPIGMFSS